MSRIFVSSDFHFFHKNILKFNPSTRPWASVEEMNDALITNWNNVVASSDHVYNLGDFAFAGVSRQIDILEQLNGHHHLIRGNHDQMWRKQQNIDKALAGNWFASIQDYIELKYDHKTICMFHYAPRVWNKAHHGSYFLYGHSHGSLPGIGRSMDVGIDSSEMVSNGAPFLLDDVLAFLEPRQYLPIDHHNSETGQ